MTLTVGFDLDMTLIDPRPGMVELFDVLAAETGLPLDGPAFVTRLGPPLQQEFARYGFDGPTVDHLVHRYRALYSDIVIPATTAMPGAPEAVSAVTENEGQAIVITAKFAAHAQQHLAALGIEADAVIGERYSTAKGGVLSDYGAEIYVGDHLGDVAGARTADALAVAVATGPISAEDLAAAGADVVLEDLTGFPAWLDGYLLATVH